MHVAPALFVTLSASTTDDADDEAVGADDVDVDSELDDVARRFFSAAAGVDEEDDDEDEEVDLPTMASSA